MAKYNIKNVNIDQIKAGDCIMHNGEMKTVSNSNIKYSSFMGLSIFGDTYNLGYKPVKLINFITA